MGAETGTGTEVLPFSSHCRKRGARPALTALVSNPSEVPSSVETVTAPASERSAAAVPDAELQGSSTSVAESDHARLTAAPDAEGLVQDKSPLAERLRAVRDHARPLVERARPYTDVFLPYVELMDDPYVQDLRAQVDALLMRARAAAGRLDLGRVSSAARIANAGARHLADLRPNVPAPRISMPPRGVAASTTPHVAPITMPSVKLPIASAARSVARRLRPGRWAFRTVAVAFVALVAATPSLQQAMIKEIDWTRSVVESMKIPQLEMPNIAAFQLPGQDAAIPAKLAPAQFELPPLNAYSASFERQAAYPTVAANATVEWVVALRNTGSVGWYRGISGAQAALALADGTEVAVQTTAYVAPGEIGWFIAKFRAPAGSGTHAVALLPRIDGRGKLPDLGIFALVTVR
jgi:hypothetical protein